MIYTVTLNPALDKTVCIPRMTVDAVNRITRIRTDPGGKGINVSKVIAGLGGQSRVLALLGGSTGQTIAHSLEEMGLACQFTFVPGQTRTNLKIVDPLLHTHTDLNEPGPAVDEAILETMLDDLVDQLEKEDLVVLSGSLPQGAPVNTYRHWALRCREAGARVFLDAEGAALALGLEASPWLVKPNRRELELLMEQPLDTAGALIQAGQSLMDRGVEHVVISLGAEGALFLTRDRILQAPGLKVDARSTVGAGDSMVAALALALEQNRSLEDTIRLSMAAAAAKVMRDGSQSPEFAQVEALMSQVRFRAL